MVYVHLANGFEEIEALAPVDVLRRAGIEVKTVSLTGERLVTGSHGITVQSDLLYDEVDYNAGLMIVLPGGMPGAKNLAAHQGLADQILGYSVTGKWLAAICAAPMVLGSLGILKGKTAVIFPGMEDYLIGAKVGQRPVEIDGKIITSKGIGTAMEFALALVEQIKGQTVAEALRKAMVLG
jgi:4-methyl-5(b-hydroxyethyl)-thiazole monophosphate biosynthesis